MQRNFHLKYLKLSAKDLQFFWISFNLICLVYVFIRFDFKLLVPACTKLCMIKLFMYLYTCHIKLYDVIMKNKLKEEWQKQNNLEKQHEGKHHSQKHNIDNKKISNINHTRIELICSGTWANPVLNMEPIVVII